MKRAMTVEDFEPMACSILFGGKTLLSDEMTRCGVQYRVGRGVADVRSAVRKAGKNGNGRTENELGLLSVYLHQIFKRAR